MKWSIVGLMLLGVIAAACAAVLVASFRSQSRVVVMPQILSPSQAQIVIATRNMPAMTVVDGQSVRTSIVPVSEAPEGYLRSPTEVVGKLLAVPVVEGQVITNAAFAAEGSGARLASALGKGKRSFSLSLARSEAGLAYAGCMVDVLASITKPGADGSQRGDAMAMTLLQAVAVLGVDDRSVVSQREHRAEASAQRSDRDRMLVTLMVNSTQAKALQLAQKYGSLSLALRNPLDAESVDQEAIALGHPGLDEYSRLLEVLAPVLPTPPVSVAVPSEPLNQEEVPAKSTAPPAPVEPSPAFRVLVNRGGRFEVFRFHQPGLAAPGKAETEAGFALDAWVLEVPPVPVNGTSLSRAGSPDKVD